LFSDIDVSQGSAATRTRCDGIFDNSFIANFLENLAVRNFENRLRFDEVTRTSSMSRFSWDAVWWICRRVGVAGSQRRRAGDSAVSEAGTTRQFPHVHAGRREQRRRPDAAGRSRSE